MGKVGGGGVIMEHVQKHCYTMVHVKVESNELHLLALL